MAKLTNKKSNDQVKEILPRSVTCPSITSLDTSASLAQRDFISCLNITPSPCPGANVKSQNVQEKSSDKESLLKNKQENDCSVQKINNSRNIKSVRGSPAEPVSSEPGNVLKKVNISLLRTCKSEGKFPVSSTSGQVSADPADLASSFSNIFHASSVSAGPISRAAVNKSVSDYGRPADLLSRTRSPARSASAEPEFLQFWLERDRSLVTDIVTGATNLQPPPAEGVFFAQPVTLLSSDSESDIDTDDAQTVIFKSSPYSSPGPGHVLSRSASTTMTTSPTSLPPSSPSETPPPPRPPPPTDYQPSYDYFQSLPRNWRERQKFLFPYS